MRHRDSISRREALGGIILLPALAGFIASTQTVADAKVSQSVEHYRNKPNGSQKCSGCRFYQPGHPASANGTCSIVAGSISPNGWCQAYVAK